MSQTLGAARLHDPGADDEEWLAEAARLYRAEHDGRTCCEDCAVPPPPPPGEDLVRWRARARLERAEAAERAVAQAHGRQAVAIAEWVALYAAPDADPAAGADAGAVLAVAEEVAAALHLTDLAAGQLVDRAVRLVGLPCTLAALSCGDLDLRRAGIVVDATVLLSPAGAAEVDRRLCGPGGSGLQKTSGELRAEAARVVGQVDAAAVVRRSRAAVAARRVRTRDLLDGMAELVATGPAPAVHRLHEGISALGLAGRDATRAGRGTGDPEAVPGVDDGVDGRGVDAHRFDALCAAVAAAGTEPGAPDPRPARTTLLVSLPALLGHDSTPAELSGYGPVPAWMAQLAARDARLRRVLTDPLTGQVVAVDGHTYPPGFLAGPEPGEPPPGGPPEGGPPPDDRPPDDRPPGGSPPDGPPPAPRPAAGGCRTVAFDSCPVHATGGGSYRIPAAVARFVRARWDRCTAPGCRRAAQRCDVDHVTAHPGGPTCPCNLAPLCRRHHLMKHATPHADDRSPRADWARRAGTRRRRWQVHRCDAGHQHWTSPLGREHVVAPPAVLGSVLAARSATALPPLTYPLEPRSRTVESSGGDRGDRGDRGPVGLAGMVGLAGLDPDRPPF